MNYLLHDYTDDILHPYNPEYFFKAMKDTSAYFSNCPVLKDLSYKKKMYMETSNFGDEIKWAKR